MLFLTKQLTARAKLKNNFQTMFYKELKILYLSFYLVFYLTNFVLIHKKSPHEIKGSFKLIDHEIIRLFTLPKDLHWTPFRIRLQNNLR